ncbi:Hpt domain-containing protein [Ramlibacter sp.]|uniref:Hpt domain-containing protein n=1 Tax=Ramlibacter sp. TaxID=1917967 RepID=UPI003D101D1B
MTTSITTSTSADLPLVESKAIGVMERYLPAQEVRVLVEAGLAACERFCITLKSGRAEAQLVRSEAHKLRGSAGTLGFARVASIAARIEHASALDAALVSELEHAATATSAAVRDHYFNFSAA